MKVIAVIGANYGDEGKGLVTDALVNLHGSGTVVRFNGGAQAGHTVVLPNGRRHVFSHVGSGALAGADTYLSKHFVIHPPCFLAELKNLTPLKPRVYVNNECLVTTPWDVILNQFKEIGRGKARHGSVGYGFGETVARGNLPYQKLIARIASRHTKELHAVLSKIQYAFQFQAQTLLDDPEFGQMSVKERSVLMDIIDNPEGIQADFEEQLSECFSQMILVDKGIYALPNKPIIFEGAQGLLLDQNVPGVHKTRSNTGLDNVLQICKEEGLELKEVVFVTRPYVTRHGAGPLPGEGLWKSPVEDRTNVHNTFQEGLRLAGQDWTELDKRMSHEMRKVPLSVSCSVAVTCCDQISWPYITECAGDTYEVDEEDFVPDLRLLSVDNVYTGWGPTRETFKKEE